MSFQKYFIFYNRELKDSIEDQCKNSDLIYLFKFKNLPVVCVKSSLDEETIESLSFVTFVSSDVEFQICNILNERNIYEDRDNWGLDRIDQRFLPLNQKYRHAALGKDVNAYVVDTGIKLNHNDFGGRVTPLFDGYRSPSDSNFGDDDQGHGTHVASIFGGNRYGVAPQVNLFSIKSFSSSGSTTLSNILNGFDSILTHHNSQSNPGVVNMSFSGSGNNVLDNAVLDLINNGLVCVVAAGNLAQNASLFSPARVGKAITVGASDIKDRYAFFSNTSISSIGGGGVGPNNVGSAIDIIAPGLDIRAAYIGRTDSARSLSGTSMAAPFVAGAAALYLETNRSSSPETVKEFILNSSTPDVIEFNENAIEAGTPNRLLHIPNGTSNLRWLTPSGLIASGQEKNSLIFTLEAESFDLDENPINVEYELISGNLPPGLILSSSGKISGNLPEVSTNTNYEFTVLASDGISADSREFSIRVINVNAAPIWNSRVPRDLGQSYGEFSPNNDVFIDFFNFVDPVDNEKTFPAISDDDEVLTFSIIDGVLPNGLELSFDGIIEGIIEQDIFDETNDEFINFEFVIRVSDGSQFKDKSFFMSVSRNQEEINTPPIWNTLSYIDGPILSIKNNEYIETFIDAFDPDGDSIHYKIDNTNFPPEDFVDLSDADYSVDYEFITLQNDPERTTYKEIEIERFANFKGLPPELKLDKSGKISGKINCDALPGTYYFQVSVTDGVDENLRIFSIVVEDTEQFITPPVETITWETPEGLLGIIKETEPSWFSVLATTESPEEIEYVLSPGSKLLPKGLFLDIDSGSIKGIVSYVNKTTTYKFKVRARLKNKPFVFKDREFSITVDDLYQEPVMKVSYVMTGSEKEQYFEWHLDPSIIPDNFIFRQDDTNFGRNVFPKMHIIGGLPVTSSERFWNSMKLNSSMIRPQSTYHQKLAVKIGDLKIAKARDNNGNVIYEVLYYEINDPRKNASGFDKNGQEVAQVYKKNDMSTVDISFFYPKSVNNWRLDISNDIGFVRDEDLPRWMASEQTINDPNSKIGYVTALEIAFIKPGLGQTLLDLLKTNSEFLREFESKYYIIDRYLLEDYTYEIKKTEFDKTGSSETTFDDGTTVFDLIENKQLQKYFKFPAGDILGTTEKI